MFNLPRFTETPLGWRARPVEKEIWVVTLDKWAALKSQRILRFAAEWHDPATAERRGRTAFTGEAISVVVPPLGLLALFAVVPEVSCEASLELPSDGPREYWVSLDWKGPGASARLRARPDEVDSAEITAPCLSGGASVHRPAQMPAKGE